MKVIVESENVVSVTTLPDVFTENCWVLDNKSNKILSIDKKDDKVVLKNYGDVKLSANSVNDGLNTIVYREYDFLVENKIYYAHNPVTKEKYTLYTIPNYEKYDKYVIDCSNIDSLVFGSDGECDIIIRNLILAKQQLSLNYDKVNGSLLVTNMYPENRLFINNIFYENQYYLQPGDSIFIGGLTIYFFGSILLVSNNSNNVSVRNEKIRVIIQKENPEVDYSKYIDRDVLLFEKTNYYQRPPRFKREIEKKTFNIDPPTQKENQEETPVLFTVAPMLTMGLMSMMTGVTAFQKLITGESEVTDQLPAILTAVCMLVAMMIFPLVQKSYNKRKKKANEEKRIKKYREYINKKNQEINEEIIYQKTVLEENNLSIEEVRDIISNKTRRLWERRIEDPDFLEFRLGIGSRVPEIEIKYPEEHFNMDDDSLKDLITELVNRNRKLEDVPVTLNIRQNNKVGIVGKKDLTNAFLDSLMVQLMAYHGYDMLRIIILTNEENKNYWDKYKCLPYLWNNDKTARFYATTKDDINKLTSYLMEEYNYRNDLSQDSNDPINFVPYYLVITDDIVPLKNNVFISEILKNKANFNYSIIINSEKLNDISNECSMFISVGEEKAGYFSNKLSSDNQMTFVPDRVNFSVSKCISKICNIPMDINNGKFVLPNVYGFLEMFDVGNVNQLNIINRWKENDIINTLETPIGIDEQGEILKLDIHEKSHGPHGLIAGMTGSGKSEFIITYILSMALNYSPEEVQFVLIDYKGGGLALTFDNRDTGRKLPHVVGTLSNLDTVEIKRCLASINSELKRRQGIFKEAREKLNESSMDIYKYQELYRAGKLDEPMSHLLIISDEFAELKAQQPEFMDELVSAARIGRSLGVHLILCTQRPSGVVDEQIWSNSKFRVCLKVQDKTDSNDMLKRPEAAMIKNTGRFYLQVGYNEFFTLGQSAYAGVPYYESDKKTTLVDSTVDFLGDLGFIYKKDNIEKEASQIVQKGEELPNILEYIIDTSKTKELKITPLWLSSIPGTIYVDKLKTKYNYQKEDYVLNPVVGEYDEPYRQTQDILTVPLSKEGNFLLYGASGSGKELFLTTLIYSLITTYSPQELGLYILDFGTEVLNNFKDSSHVGDIVHSNDEEKVENLFKYIKTEIDFRRKKFLQYNGNYEDFIAKAEDKIPNIVIIINQYDVFSEIYNNHSEKLYELTRECNKFGIYFVMTASSINAVKNKLLQTFKTIFTLQLNNEFDYKSLYGNTNNVVPSKIYGRGLFKKNHILEFQTAYAFEKDDLYRNILAASIKTFMKYKSKLRPIPVRPKEVKFSDICKEKLSLEFIPVGMVKQDLGIGRIKIKDELSYLISFRDFDESVPFIDKFLHILDKLSEDSFVFDSKFMYENSDFKKIKYKNNDYSVLLNNINKYVNEISDILAKNNNNLRSIKDFKNIVCVIIGFDKFMSLLSQEDKDAFVNALTKAKDIQKVHFVFIDSPGGFKPYEFETWYKSSLNTISGLWIGDGFGDQYLIKPTKVVQEYFDVIGNNYGYLVENGQVKFIKLIEKIEDDKARL